MYWIFTYMSEMYAEQMFSTESDNLDSTVIIIIIIIIIKATCILKNNFNNSK
jgi:hypothetical protein